MSLAVFMTSEFMCLYLMVVITPKLASFTGLTLNLRGGGGGGTGFLVDKL